MKIKSSHIVKRSLSLIISTMLVVSMILVGMISASAWYSYYLIGYDFGNWNTTNTAYPISAIDNTTGQGYAIVKLTQNSYFKLTDGSAYRSPSADTEIDVGTTACKLSSGGDKALKFTGETGTYKVCIDLNGDKNNENNDATPYLWIEEAPVENWYLSGWINAGEIGLSNSTYKFTASGTTNVYTLTTTFSSDQGGSQYVTMNNGSTVYHPSVHGSGSGVVGSTTDTSPNGDPKWKVAAASGTKVTFTWNSSTKALSWVIGETPTEPTTEPTTVAPTEYNINISSSITNGTVTSNVTTAKAGDTVELTVKPASGYECTGVKYSYGNGTYSALGSGESYSFTMPASDVTVSATFTEIVVKGDLTISATTSSQGKITFENKTSSDLASGTANTNDEIVVTVTPNRGYAFKTLKVNDAEVTATDTDGDGIYTYEFNITENVTLSAEYESTVVLYRISGTATNGSVVFTSASTTKNTAQADDTVTVTVMPNSGYKCTGITVKEANGTVVAVNKLSSTKYTFVMPASDVTVTATCAEYTPDANHTFTVYFKAPSAYAYKPVVQLDGGTYYSMTQDEELGKIYSGGLTIYWYKYEFTVDTSTEHTLNFTTNRTRLNASITDNFAEDVYYLAVDDLMSGTEVVDLTGTEEYVRNYYRSATHMVFPYNGVTSDADLTLGFTKVDGVRYRMGNPTTTNSQVVSIKSATLIQKQAAGIESLTGTDADLLDVNLDGVVNVLDATLTQKVLVGE